MTSKPSTTFTGVRVAIDVAKLTHQVLLELPSGQRRALRIANTKTEIDHLVTTLRGFDSPCEIAFEPTGDYHRPLAYALGQAGFRLCQVSSIAVARTREALYNTWDKNDPKDAQVILQLLKHGTTQRYLDPLITGHQDLQEMANTYQQVSLRKGRTRNRPLVVAARVRRPRRTEARPLVDLSDFQSAELSDFRPALTRCPAVRRGGVTRGLAGY